MRPSIQLIACIAISVAVNAAPPETINFTLGTQPGYLEVQTADGLRSQFDIQDYPALIGMTSLHATAPGEFVLSSFDAGQRVALWRYFTETGERTPISGFTDPDSDDPLGTGDSLGPSIRDIEVLPDGNLVAIALGPARVIFVDGETGNRTVTSRSVEPAIGDGMAMERPLDCQLVENGSALLVLEQFQGLIHVDLQTGGRRMALSNQELLIVPDEFELLSSGRVAFLTRDPDVDAIWVYDYSSGEYRLLSGSFGGLSRGAGPDFEFTYNLATDQFGYIYVYDAGLQAVFSVHPLTGDRRIISGGPDNIGGGDIFPIVADKPRLWSGFTARTAGDGWFSR